MAGLLKHLYVNWVIIFICVTQNSSIVNLDLVLTLVISLNLYRALTLQKDFFRKKSSN
jgi:hypothetical protein